MHLTLPAGPGEINFLLRFAKMHAESFRDSLVNVPRSSTLAVRNMHRLVRFAGKPAALMDCGNPDWAPSQLLGHGRDSPSAGELVERYNRRRRRSRKATAASTSTTDETSCAASVDVPQLDCGSTPDERQSPSCSADHGTKKGLY